MDFRDSSFFQITGRQLPSPPDVDVAHNGVIRMPEMQLLIKFGPFVTIDEAVTMWAVRKYFGNVVPVPELFGWRTHRGTVFIYMEFIPGATLHERWDDFTSSDKESICTQLSQMLSSLRQLQHINPFIGSITRGALLDRNFMDRPKVGPHQTLTEFYQRLEWIPQRFIRPEQRYTDPYLSLLPEDSTIHFTHADVHPTHIIVSVSASGRPRIVALIDWGQSGWYPDYWEYYKMCYTTHWEDEWRRDWIPKIVEPREYEQYLMAEYSITFGAV